MDLNGQEILKSIPDRISSHEQILTFIGQHEIKSNHISLIKSLTGFNNTIICSWFKINESTYRKYVASNIEIDEVLQEEIISVLILMKHGIGYFGTMEKFKAWLSSENFYLDWKQPLSILNTLEGKRFIANMLTGMEYGDYV